MIQIKNLTKSFENTVLNNISIDIPDGSIVGLVGINGAGKSTFLRLISGVYEPDNGDVLYDGESIYKNAAIKRSLYFLTDDPYFSVSETPDSILKYYKYFYNYYMVYIDLIHYFNKFGIPLHKPLYKFSKGMKRQTSLAIGISLTPKYLFLDEAFDGVDPVARKELKELLMSVQAKNNMTVIISSHSLRELEDICDCYLIITETGAKIYNDITEFSYHKYVMAFEDKVQIRKLHVPFIEVEEEGRIIRCVTKLDYEAMQKALEKHEPKFLEEQPLSVEDAFLIKLKEEGSRNV